MIWIETQDGNLYYCSSFEIKKITLNQFLIVNQNDKTLGEYFSLNDSKNVIKKIKDIIRYNAGIVFTMPSKMPNTEKDEKH